MSDSTRTQQTEKDVIYTALFEHLYPSSTASAIEVAAEAVRSALAAETDAAHGDCECRRCMTPLEREGARTRRLTAALQEVDHG